MKRRRLAAPLSRIAIGPTETAVLVAVVKLHAQGGPVTVSRVAGALGLRSKGSVHKYLARLRDWRLIAWEDGYSGTLRPLVAEVPFGDSCRLGAEG